MFQGLGGVGDQVQDDLLDQLRVGLTGGQVRGQLAFDADAAFAQGGGAEPESLLDGVVDLGGGQFGGGGP